MDLRYCVYGLIAVSSSLGITLTTTWLFGCTPFLSNFVWNIDSNTCVNFDIFRRRELAHLVSNIIAIDVLDSLDRPEYSYRHSNYVHTTTNSKANWTAEEGEKDLEIGVLCDSFGNNNLVCHLQLYLDNAKDT